MEFLRALLRCWRLRWLRAARNTGRPRKRDSITLKLGVINLVRLQRAVTLFSVVGDYVYIHGIVLRGKGTEAVPLFFKFGFGRKGDGLRVGNQSGKVGASGGGRNWRGGLGCAGRKLASGCSVITSRMNTG